MANLLDPVSFELDAVGEITQTRWVGTFEAKPILSWSDKIRADRICRELLGENPPTEDSQIYQRAFISGQLAVRITKAPEWWTGKNSGTAMIDENVPVEVYGKCMDIEDKIREQFKKDAAAAKGEIQQELANKK